MTSHDEYRAALAAKLEAALDTVRQETGRADVFEVIAREPQRYPLAFELAVKLFAYAGVVDASLPNGVDGDPQAVRPHSGEVASRAIVALRLWQPPSKGGVVVFPSVFDHDDPKARRRKARDLQICTAVCELILRDGLTRRKAIEAVGPQFHLETRAVEYAYDAHRGVVEPIVRFRLRQAARRQE